MELVSEAGGTSGKSPNATLRGLLPLAQPPTVLRREFDNQGRSKGAAPTFKLPRHGHEPLWEGSGQRQASHWTSKHPENVNGKPINQYVLSGPFSTHPWLTSRDTVLAGPELSAVVHRAGWLCQPAAGSDPGPCLCAATGQRLHHSGLPFAPPLRSCHRACK